ncbi:MAG: transporter substrate-binding domain-containing protein [Actinomycetota bacterium]
MSRFRMLRLFATVSIVALVAAACGGSGGESGGEGSGGGSTAEGVCASVDTAGTDLLAQICAAGTITVSTDPAYPPQSSLNDATGEYEGFDIDVATEIAKRLGVEIAWEAPSWDVLTAGNWNDRWEMSVGSMTPTNERQQVLWFTEPYYFTPAVVVVPADSTVADLSTDLDGMRVGVCSGCTYESYLDKSLAIEGFTFDFVIDDAQISGYDTDTTALQDLDLGRLDAVITSVTTAQGWIDAGSTAKIVGDPVFYEPLSVALDKSATADPASLLEAVDGILAEMHMDGTLTAFSQKWYGIDLTVQV